MTTLDAATLQSLLQEVTNAARAAADAAKSTATSSPTSSSSVDWSKLLSKPSNFDYKSQEEEIRHFKDWSWQMVQYVSAIDQGYSKELADLEAEPGKPMDMATASASTRERSTKLYGLLAGLMKGRALQTVKSVANADGYEAWRQLLVSLRPSTRGRGLALMSAIMAWPEFSMKTALQPQLLRLEDSFMEAERAGVKVQDEVKVAVVLKCITGQLRTHVNLQLSEGMSYRDLREVLFKYDRAQQRWAHLVQTSDETAMEIDRVQDKGKGKKGGKDGKGKGKKGRDEKGKSKGKSGSWQSGKGKKGESKGKQSWNYEPKGKGKGQSDEKRCFKCNGTGHFAKDCRVRVVTEENRDEVPGHQQQQAQASSIPSRTPSSSTTYRVARVVEKPYVTEIKEVPVFDMRELGGTFSSEDSIRAVHYFIGDEDETIEENGEETNCLAGHERPTSIILDSGADAPIFPASWIWAGEKVDHGGGHRLQDAQGNRIPTLGKRDITVELKDIHGERVQLRERVIISDKITQPILCYGRLMENGWSLDAQEQVMFHKDYNIRVPVEMQNRSLTVSGVIRLIQEAPHFIRMMRATLNEDLKDLNHGWQRHQSGFVVGYHISDRFMDPYEYNPNIEDLFRTTLIQFEDGHWELVEMMEQLGKMALLDVQFDQPGMRGVITILTDDDATVPEELGFTLDSELNIEERRQADQEVLHEIPKAPEDEMEIAHEAEIQKAIAAEEKMDKVLVEPFDADKLVVNGVELTAESTMASLRAACSFYNLSTSGSKSKCYKRLVNYLKQMELETAREAVNSYGRAHRREPNFHVAANRPSDDEVLRHNLTHLPYQGWCEFCVAHRARLDRHERQDQTRAATMPTVSFDLCTTKALGEGEAEAQVSSSLWLIMACSQTGAVGCCPLKGKGQIKLATTEIMGFTQSLGHHAVCFQTDNEPTVRSILRCLLNARHALGLPTRITTSKIYDHSNALAENAVNRVRGLAGTLMEQLQNRIGVKLGTSNGIWSWAARHSAWLLNRFKPIKGVTPFELVNGRPYKGPMALFGEPIFAYVKTHLKGQRRWYKCIFLGKTDGQGAHIVYDGEKILLSKSVRRIGQDWGLSLGFYKEFSCHSFNYQSGFGGRIVPTKREALALPSATSLIPMEAIMVKARDPEAEAVIKKAIEENREEGELERMRKQDEKATAIPFEEDENFFEAPPTEEMKDVSGQVQHPQVAPGDLSAEVGQQAEKESSEVIAVSDDTPLEALRDTAGKKVVFEEKAPIQQQVGAQPLRVPTSGTSSASSASMSISTKATSTTRPAEAAAEGSPIKKAKSEPSKKAKIRRVEEEMELNIRSIRVGEEELFTVDEADMVAEDPIKGYGIEDEVEENFVLKIPECLWSNVSLDEMPEAPNEEIELEADRFEIERLVRMNVLREATEKDENIQRSLTVKFVRDWRIKVRREDGVQEKKQWLRRSRLVAREYAIDQRDDTFSPASSTHLLRLIPMIYLFKLGELQELQDTERVPTLGCLDVKDAFLQVPQQEPLRISLGGYQWIVEKNLPGQRLGARAWFDYLAEFLEKEAGFEYCVLNPCLAKNEHMTFADSCGRCHGCWKKELHHGLFHSAHQEEIWNQHRFLGEGWWQNDLFEKNLCASGWWFGSGSRRLHRDHVGGFWKFLWQSSSAEGSSRWFNPDRRQLRGAQHERCNFV